MATQEARLDEWRSAAGEVIRASRRSRRFDSLYCVLCKVFCRRKGEDRTRQKKRGATYQDRLVEAAEKGVAQHDSWLRQGSGYIEAEGHSVLWSSLRHVRVVEGEETFKFRQDEIVQNVSVGGAQKAFDLNLPELGPYKIDYSPNGRHLLIGGRKGHLAEFDWQTGKLLTEIQVYAVDPVQFHDGVLVRCTRAYET